MVSVEAFVDRPDITSVLPPTVGAVIFGVLVTTVLLGPSFFLFQRVGIAVLVRAVFATLIVFAIVKYANALHAGFLSSLDFRAVGRWSALANCCRSTSRHGGECRGDRIR